MDQLPDSNSASEDGGASASDNAKPARGGCLCGAFRYELIAPPSSVGYCHCRICQRASGAPMVAWATLPKSSFVVSSGKLASYRSSAKAQRWFCATCGSPIAFEFTDGRDEIDVTLASLDEPDRLRPQYHIWIRSRRAWLMIGDDLPRHDERGPDG